MKFPAALPSPQTSVNIANSSSRLIWSAAEPGNATASSASSSTSGRIAQTEPPPASVFSAQARRQAPAPMSAGFRLATSASQFPKSGIGSVGALAMTSAGGASDSTRFELSQRDPSHANLARLAALREPACQVREGKRRPVERLKHAGPMLAVEARVAFQSAAADELQPEMAGGVGGPDAAVVIHAVVHRGVAVVVPAKRKPAGVIVAQKADRDLRLGVVLKRSEPDVAAGGDVVDLDDQLVQAETSAGERQRHPAGLRRLIRFERDAAVIQFLERHALRKLTFPFQIGGPGRCRRRPAAARLVGRVRSSCARAQCRGQGSAPRRSLPAARRRTAHAAVPDRRG